MTVAVIAKRSIAAGLALWLSGFIVLLSCSVSMRASSADSCPLAKLGHCNKEKEHAETVSDQTTDNGVECCAFASGFFDKSRSLDTNSIFAFTAPTALEITAPREKLVASYPSSYQPLVRPLPKNDTFLKTCNFRL